MMRFFTSFFGWLPLELQTLCIGVVVIFFIVTVLRIIRFVLDLLPFL